MENNEPEPKPKAKRKEKKALVASGTRGLTFDDSNVDSMYRFCIMVANSKEFRDIDTPEQALVRLQAGLELGLSPIWSITNIMVVNGRPSVWGDAMLGLVLRHPECEDVIETIENEGTEEETAVCEVRRRGRVPVIRKFSVADVRRAGLDRKAQSVHGSYPKRMRQMRARSWALRDAFADTLRGLAVVEELREIVAEERAAKTTKEVILPDETISPKQMGLNPEAEAESEKETPDPTHSGSGDTPTNYSKRTYKHFTAPTDKTNIEPPDEPDELLF